VTAKRKASRVDVAAGADPGETNHAVIVDHETVAVEELAREKRRNWFFIGVRVCLMVTAALVVEVLLAAYQRLLVDGDDA
jgi:hypothetical protein